MKLLNREFPASKAAKLGTFLNISHARIQEFTYENYWDNYQVLLMSVINFWLESDEEISWTKLAKAVEDCGNGDLAAKIRQENNMGGEC